MCYYTSDTCLIIQCRCGIKASS